MAIRVYTSDDKWRLDALGDTLNELFGFLQGNNPANHLGSVECLQDQYYPKLPSEPPWIYIGDLLPLRMGRIITPDNPAEGRWLCIDKGLTFAPGVVTVMNLQSELRAMTGMPHGQIAKVMLDSKSQWRFLAGSTLAENISTTVKVSMITVGLMTLPEGVEFHLVGHDGDPGWTNWPF